VRILIAVAAGVVALACRPLPPQAPKARLVSCGAQSCDARTSYCEMIKTDVLTIPSTYACRPLPSSCADKANPSCDCFPQGTRCDFCSQLDRDGVLYFQRTCIGGR
jgi:hypothetical protein